MSERWGSPTFAAICNISAWAICPSTKAAIFLMDYAGQRRLKMLVRIDVRDAAEAPDFVAALDNAGL